MTCSEGHEPFDPNAREEQLLEEIHRLVDDPSVKVTVGTRGTKGVCNYWVKIEDRSDSFQCSGKTRLDALVNARDMAREMYSPANQPA